MPKAEHIERPRATENFERAMKTRFSAPQADIVNADKAKGAPRHSVLQKPELSDKDWKESPLSPNHP